MQFSSVRPCILLIYWIWCLKYNKIYSQQKFNVKYVHPTGCFLYWDLYTHTTLTGLELNYGCPLIIFIKFLPPGCVKVCESICLLLVLMSLCLFVHANDKSQEEERGKRKFKMCGWDRLLKRLTTSNAKVTFQSLYSRN